MFQIVFNLIHLYIYYVNMALFSHNFVEHINAENKLMDARHK